MFSLPHQRCEIRQQWVGASGRIAARLLLLGAIGVIAGCRTVAPIHLWEPPRLKSIKGESLVLMEIAGPTDTSDGIRDALIAQTGGDAEWGPAFASPAAHAIKLLLPEQLKPNFEIELVSNVENASSDILVAGAARRSGVRYLLRGEIMHRTGRTHSDEDLSVVWRLVGLDAEAGTQATSITIDRSTIELRHPDLMALPDPIARLHQAMAREALGLVHESVVRQEVELANSLGALGSRSVRRGNALARLGNWPVAEEIWVQTLDRYPLQTAAWINASIAASARQDFALAKERITRAIQLSILLPVHRRLAEETLVWIELQQRDYVNSFDLPDPIGGWRVTHQQENASSPLSTVTGAVRVERLLRRTR